VSKFTYLSKFFAIGYLIFGVISFCYGENLFVDPNFDDNGVHDWLSLGHPFVTEDVEVHSLPYSATNTITTVSDEDYYGQIYQIIEPYTAGEPIYMRAWIKTNLAVGSTARAGIIVEFLDSNNQLIPNSELKTVVGGVNDWFEIYITGYAPAGAAKARAGAFIFAQQADNSALNGTAYVDDFYIDKIELPGSLIENPGFEIPALAYWTTGLDGWPFIDTTDEKHSGEHSAVDIIDDVSGEGGYFGFIYQTRPYSPGTQIYVSAWGKSDISELSMAKGGVIVQFLDSAGDPIAGTELKSEIGGGTDWRQLYIEGLAPPGTAEIRIGAFLWASQGDTTALGGKFYIDDFVASTEPIPPPAPPSDIINGDFENGVNDWNWDYRPFVTSTVAHSGNYSANHTITNTDAPNDYLAEIYQDIPYSEGQAVFVTAWTKTDITSTFIAVGGIKIQFYDDTGSPVGSAVQAIIGGIRDWTLLYVNDIAPPATAFLRVSGFAWAQKNQGIINGEVYIDDVELSDTPPSDLILNPGFEDGLSGWIQDPLNYRDIESTDEDYHSGNFSAKGTIVDTDSDDVDYWSRLYQEFDFEAEQQIYATLWAKTVIDPTSAATAGLKVEFLDENGQALDELTDSIVGQTGWTYLYVTGLSPVDTVKVRISCFIFCPEADTPLDGVVYFDDVVASLDPLPPPNFPMGLSNTGFEAGLNDWTDLYGPPSEIDNIDPHSGVYSAKKTFVAIPDNDYYSIIYQDLYYNSQGTPFPEDTEVYLTAFLKSNIHPGATARVGIRLEAFNEPNEPVEIGKDGISAINDWRQLYIKATIPAATRKVRVMGYAWAKQGDSYAYDPPGTVNFDDFVYSYEPLPPPPLQTELLNPDFENGLNEWKVPYKPAFVIDDPAIVYSGNYAVGFEIDDVSERNYFGEVRQDVAVSPGRRVKAAVWVKTDIDSMSQAKARLKITFWDSDDMFISMYGSEEMGGINDWEQLSVDVIAPQGAAKLSFQCNLFAPQGDIYGVGGKAYFDSASLAISPYIIHPLSCLLAGTKITLADGTTKAIEDINIGEKVLGVNEEDGSFVETEVVETYYHPGVEGFLVITTEDNRTLKITGNHPVRNGNRYIEASSLKIGDTISILENKKLTSSKIVSIIRNNSSVDVYNLEVDKTHNYFAEGCLVHNKLIYTRE
jgi:hypothetical protein